MPNLFLSSGNPSYRRQGPVYIMHNQYHGCWWSGVPRSQVISSHGIHLVIPEYSGFSTKSVNSLHADLLFTLYFSSYWNIAGRWDTLSWWEYSHLTYSISWLLMSWRRQEPGHQQPWYWPSLWLTLWDSLSWLTRTSLFIKFNITAADVLATSGWRHQVP